MRLTGVKVDDRQLEGVLYLKTIMNCYMINKNIYVIPHFKANNEKMIILIMLLHVNIFIGQVKCISKDTG